MVRPESSGQKKDLGSLFLGLQEQLATTLRIAREAVDHATTKGDISELNWAKMLSGYLPSRYRVSKAFVIDADGSLSDQVDLVIHDQQYSPLIFNHPPALYVPAESVYAVFEIKQEIGAAEIAYAGRKASSVRELRRTSVPISHAGGTLEAREPFDIIAGILALRSNWSTPVDATLAKVLGDLAPAERLDLGCALETVAFDATYQDSECSLETSSPETSLIFFFLRLLDKLQRLGTVTAMDLKDYGRFLTTE